jgi:hypothetical protein
MQKMFFNSSMPRSGSELLQVILHQNPLIYASSTSPLLEYQFGARVNYNLPEVTSQNAELNVQPRPFHRKVGHIFWKCTFASNTYPPRN